MFVFVRIASRRFARLPSEPTFRASSAGVGGCFGGSDGGRRGDVSPHRALASLNDFSAEPLHHGSGGPRHANELFPDAPSPLQEFSVVFTDRSLNHMSEPFAGAMQDVSVMLREAYGAAHAVVVPGGGSFAMESVARHLGVGHKVVVVRNGYFSYRWSQILAMADPGGAVYGTRQVVLRAQPVATEEGLPRYAPPSIDRVCDTIRKERPAVVFAPHVETSTGLLLPDEYVAAMATAVHAVGGLLVLDCIASGAMWVNMADLGVDVLLSAPQKTWTGPACAGFVALSETAAAAVRAKDSTSFALDLRQWLAVMESYTQPERGDGARAGPRASLYHTTLPTDALVKCAEAMKETHDAFPGGLGSAKVRAQELGILVHRKCTDKGLVRLAAPGFEAPSVLVFHNDDPEVVSNFKRRAGTQVAAGVPLHLAPSDPVGSRTFRVGLFGLDKLRDPVLTAQVFGAALDEALP